VRRADAAARLLKLEGHLKSRGIEHVYLFGSVARDAATDESDVDIAFDVRHGVPFDAFDMGGILMDLKEALGVNIDLVERRSMSANFAREVGPELIRVF
jgi:uncharacterized protein